MIRFVVTEAIQNLLWMSVIFGLILLLQVFGRSKNMFLMRFPNMFSLTWKNMTALAWHKPWKAEEGQKLPLTKRIDFRPLYAALFLAWLFAAPLLDWYGIDPGTDMGWEIVEGWKFRFLVWVVLYALLMTQGQWLFNKRREMLNKYYRAADSHFKYGIDQVKKSGKKGSGWGQPLNEHNYIRVKKWENGEPKELDVVVPPAFDVTDPEKITSFEQHFSMVTKNAEKGTWDFDWEPSNGIVRCVLVDPLPTTIDMPSDEELAKMLEDCGRPNSWNFIPLGVSRGGVVEGWDLKAAPQGIVAGATGGGKSVLETGLLKHVLERFPKNFECYFIDLKQTELPMFSRFPSVKAIATNLPDAVDLLDEVQNRMHERQQRMSKAQVTEIDDIPEFKQNEDTTILVVVDESAELLLTAKGAGPIVKEENAMRGEAATKIRSITQLGRAMRVNVVLATQRLEVEAIGGGAVKNNCQFRVLLGRAEENASKMALDNNHGRRIRPKTPGRGIIQSNGDEVDFQTFFISKKEWVKNRKSLEFNDGIYDDPVLNNGKLDTPIYKGDDREEAFRQNMEKLGVPVDDLGFASQPEKPIEEKTVSVTPQPASSGMFDMIQPW